MLLCVEKCFGIMYMCYKNSRGGDDVCFFFVCVFVLVLFFVVGVLFGDGVV